MILLTAESCVSTREKGKVLLRSSTIKLCFQAYFGAEGNGFYYTVIEVAGRKQSIFVKETPEQIQNLILLSIKQRRKLEKH